ncbi:hypothetical protein [Lichenihabitans psoromatis]|uniref:hypothetical protein n=1 Tax=Lichenihabitans psoromatis TaxID=2528642 RepID=UPI001FDEF6BC|nr:hypothetical protein [Lichenihabitans psoromatis]
MGAIDAATVDLPDPESPPTATSRAGGLGFQQGDRQVEIRPSLALKTIDPGVCA